MGANVEAKDNNGWTAFMWAVSLGTEKVVAYLKELGVNRSVNDEHFKKALAFAEGSKNAKIIKLLKS